MKKAIICIAHASHLDLFWMGNMQTCLDWGADIINDAVEFAQKDPNFYYIIETIRFLEYFLKKYPERKEILLKLIECGQIEICADYTDRMENQHDGESIARNLVYGKKMLRDLLGIESNITYHPDIPGFGDQVPQIFAKAGIKYALTARGFHKGARFNWTALDGSKVIMYDFPAHYSYFALEEEVLGQIEDIKKNISSDKVILCCGAGDLGAAGTFVIRRPDGKGERIDLRAYIKDLALRYPEFEFKMCNVEKTLDSMNSDNLPALSGESPPRWGLSSGREIKLFQLDRLTAATILRAEKFYSISKLLSMPVELSYPKHLLKHGGSSGGRRKYMELDIMPADLAGYFELAWRMLFVSQDHNYGGVDGAQSMFDNYRYKEAALRIGTDVIAASLRNIATRIGTEEGSYIVFNPTNWERSESLEISGAGLDSLKNYCAIDQDGNRTDVFRTDKGYKFLCQNVPSFGYKTYTIKEGFAGAEKPRQIREDDRNIILRNKWYELIVDKTKGAITLLRDLEEGVDLIKSDSFLTFAAYRDTDDSASERVVNKPLIDQSAGHTYSVRAVTDNAIETTVEIITEILEAKIKIHVSLKNYKKQININPVIYWHGLPEVQIRMDLGFVRDFNDVWYGVAYGGRKKGEALEKEINIKPGDEIHPDLYHRYREVQQWFALQSPSHGICVGSTHSAFEFDGSAVSAVMARDVKNCGEWDVWYLNEGELSYDFRLTSYSGSYKDNHAYRIGLETINPLSAVQKEKTESACLPASGSFLTVQGVMSALKPADNGDGYILRTYNNTPDEIPFEVGGILGLKACEICDFEENRMDGCLEKLMPYEIKSVRMRTA